MAHILLCDDDEQILRMLEDMLGRDGHTVSLARNGREALRLYKGGTFDLVITDLIMPEQEGLETIAQLRRHNPEVRIIAISGGGRVMPRDYLETASFIGANRTFAKPFERVELLEAVAELT